MNNSKNNILFSIIFIIVGIAVMCFGIYMHKENKKFLETAKKVEATITDITYDYNASSEDTTYHVFVRFEVDGNEYKGELNEYSSSMHINDAITIFYDPENPYNFKGNSVNYMGYILLAFGGIFAIVGVFSIFSKSYTKETSL